MSAPKTLCLCMIVRDESHVIARAIRSVKPYIDYWIICDTGSIDDTPGIILNELHDIPGELHSERWVDFGYNRTQCLNYAKGKSDYCLIMDADMISHVKAPFKDKLEADSYYIRYEGELDYAQTMLVANRHDWRFIGVTHEYIHSETAVTAEPLPQLTLEHFGDGGNRSDKFKRDIRLLLSEWNKEPDNSRTAFYLAQSYRNLGQYKKALKWYKIRIQLNGWDEETWFSQMEIGQMEIFLEKPESVIVESLLKAYEMRPWRLESLYFLVKYYREKGKYVLGYLYAQIILNDPPYPEDILFVDRRIYSHLFQLEFGICAYAMHRSDQAIIAFNKVLEADDIPNWVEEAAWNGLEKCGVKKVHNSVA